MHKKLLTRGSLLIAIGRSAKLATIALALSASTANASPLSKSGHFDVAVAQPPVKGKVTDKSGDALPGATVQIKGTTRGTITDADGNFTLDINNGETLVISSIGYTDQELTFTGQEELVIRLNESTANLEELVVTGTRSAGRVKTESPVPVDVIGVSQLTTQAPQNNLNQILNVVAPSFTSNTSTVADGTDHIDPAQLRGLGPDQVLVLLNSKRRHTTSLVNVNGTPGRGSVGTDLNAIPAFAIDKIEVLRDGASAQYGSDAIAGIINVKMKEATGKFDLSLYSGANFSVGSNDHTGDIDGESFQIDANYGFKVLKKGFINLTGTGLIRKPTYRANFETGSIFNAYNAIEMRAQQGGGNVNTLPTDLGAIQRFAKDVTYFSSDVQKSIAATTSIADLQNILKFDVTENELGYRGLERRDFNMRIGQSDLKGGQLYVNSLFPINDNLEVYVFGGYSFRNGNAAGFYRRPNQSRTYTGIYINGFLPEIDSDVIDGSIAGGIRGKLGEFNFDFSNTFGSNTFNYRVENTSNATLLQNSPTSFDAGGLGFKQNTLNLDLSRKYDFLQGFNLAFGAETRFEKYKIDAGQIESHANYDINGKPIADTSQVTRKDFFGNTRPGGSQVFPGFKPASAKITENADRTSVGVYVDTELDITKKLLVSGAVRYENYSDFGSTTNFKLASRYKLTPNINIRGAISTGFRAPSLAQIYYNTTSTLFVGGIPYEVGTFANASNAAKIIGIPELKQEESTSYSVGFTAKIPSANLSFTVDGYFIKIDDRVILTDQFSRPSGDNLSSDALELKRAFDEANANAATFFSNAIDTESKGLDIVISHKANLSDGVTIRNDLAGTISETKQVGAIQASNILKKNGQLNQYYSESSRVYLEEAFPRVKFNLGQTLTLKKLDLFMRNTFFGKVTDPSTVDVDGDGLISAIIVNNGVKDVAVENEHPVFRGRLITDLSVGYSFTKTLKLVVGANNIFDIYPDRNYNTVSAKRPSGVENGKVVYNNPASTVNLSNAGQFIYSRNISQFGMNGRFLFARLNISL